MRFAFTAHRGARERSAVKRPFPFKAGDMQQACCTPMEDGYFGNPYE